MKHLKRIFLTLTALILALSVSTSALAAEAAGEDTAVIDAESDSAPLITDGAENNAAQAPENPLEEDENPFSAVFSVVTEYSGEIFSALAFLGTLIVAAAYKRGMLPTLKKALTGIKGALTDASDKTEATLTFVERRLGEIDECIDHASRTADGILDTLEGLDGRISLMEGEYDGRAVMKTLMLSQIDMLYDIFMCSALPQYKKDEIGERVAAMKSELNGARNEGK